MKSGGGSLGRPMVAGLGSSHERRILLFHRQPVRRSMEFGSTNWHSYMVPNLQYTCPSIWGPQRGIVLFRLGDELAASLVCAATGRRSTASSRRQTRPHELAECDRDILSPHPKQRPAPGRHRTYIGRLRNKWGFGVRALGVVRAGVQDGHRIEEVGRSMRSIRPPTGAPAP